MAERLALGMMSGTSCDGIDAAVIAVRGRGLGMSARLLAHVHRPFSPALRRRILAVMAPATATVDELLRLAVDLGAAHVPVARAALRAARIQPAALSVAGVHGQTICHRPPSRRGETGASWQLGQFAPLAAALGVPVVYDLRAADLAVGGQGAPLVPWTDLVLAGHAREARMLVNLGGVCNATFLPPGRRPADVRAGDLGPCNLLLDGLIAARTGGRQALDRGGALAARGVVQPAVLARLQAIIAKAIPASRHGRPVSLGREQFGTRFVTQALAAGRGLAAADLLATAAEAVAAQLANAVAPFARRSRSALRVMLAGGGCRNAALVSAIARRLAPAPVEDLADALGIPAEAKEAVSFALLALASADKMPANLPAVTGARRAVVLGSRVWVG